MQLAQIWRYPVKSMVGETVETAHLGPTGIGGDRLWATRDLERGGIRGAKKIPGLMTCAARTLPEGQAAITLPDGRTTRTDDPQVHHLLSAALGHRVQLEPLAPAADTAHYRRGRPDHADPMGELRAIFGREAQEPLPDLRVFPPELAEFESPPGTYYDAFPLMLLTTAALADLRAALPDSAVDVRRFRPSLVIAADDPGHPEFSWVGRTLRIGEAVLRIGDRCPRCVMVTQRIDDTVPADRAVLRHIVRALGQDLGVYATVESPGPVRVGDPVTIG